MAGSQVLKLRSKIPAKKKLRSKKGTKSGNHKCTPLGTRFRSQQAGKVRGPGWSIPSRPRRVIRPHQGPVPTFGTRFGKGEFRLYKTHLTRGGFQTPTSEAKHLAQLRSPQETSETPERGGGGEDELLQPAATRRRPAAARLPGEGRVPAAGVPSGRLPTPGAGLPAGRLPPAGLPAAVRAAAAALPAAATAAEQRAFLHGGMPGGPLLLLSPGRLLLREEDDDDGGFNQLELGYL